MTSPVTPRPYEPFAPPAQAAAPMERPGGVTFACVTSIVLGALGILGGLLLFAWGAAFSIIPILGIFGFLAAMAGVVVGGMGALGVATGVAGLRGAPWARWTMVVLYVLGALLGLTSIAAGAPVLLVGLNGVALWFLLNEDANRWYAAAGAARLPAHR